MIYNLATNYQEALGQLEYLKAQGKSVVISEYKPSRTIKQNAYLHVLFGLFGSHFGYTIEESKELIKETLGYVYQKKGKTFKKKTSKMNTEEISIFIDKFREVSMKYGCYLPTSEEYSENKIYFDNELERVARYVN